MKVKMSNIVWHDTELMQPAEDGKYLVVWWEEIELLNYTKEFGWNTSRDRNGNVDGSTCIPIDHITLWAERPAITEVDIDED